MLIQSEIAYWSGILSLGLIAGVCPCNFPIIGALIAHSAGTIKTWRENILAALAFFSGVAIIFVPLGVVAALAGGVVAVLNKPAVYLIGGAILFFMGLDLAGLIKIPFPVFQLTTKQRRGTVGALMVGFIGALVVASRAGPILVAVLTTVAATGQSVSTGTLTLFVYSIAFSTPMVALGFISSGLLAAAQKKNNHGFWRLDNAAV